MLQSTWLRRARAEWINQTCVEYNHFSFIFFIVFFFWHINKLKLAFAQFLLHAIRRLVVVVRLRDRNFVQPVFLEHRGHTCPTCFPIPNTRATAPVRRLFGTIILGERVSVHDQQMLAPLADHEVQLTIVEHIFVRRRIVCHPNEIIWGKKINKNGEHN